MYLLILGLLIGFIFGACFGYNLIDSLFTQKDRMLHSEKHQYVIGYRSGQIKKSLKVRILYHLIIGDPAYQIWLIEQRAMGKDL